MAEGPKIIEVLMHDVLREDFERWLNSRGLELNRTPFLDREEDGAEAMEVWAVAPGEEAMRAARARLVGEAFSIGPQEMFPQAKRQGPRT